MHKTKLKRKFTGWIKCKYLNGYKNEQQKHKYKKRDFARMYNLKGRKQISSSFISHFKYFIMNKPFMDERFVIINGIGQLIASIQLQRAKITIKKSSGNIQKIVNENTFNALKK